MLRRLVTLLCLAAFAAPAAVSAQTPKQVLVLYSTRRDAQIVTIGDREIPAVLEDGLGHGIDYYSEFIDRARFPEPNYRETFGDYLRAKYAGRHFDVLIAMQDLAVEFVANFRDSAFPGTPLVFFSSSEIGRTIPNATGVISPINFGGTLELALQLQPDLRQVFVVSGADAGDREYEAVARAQFKTFANRISPTFLSGVPADDLAKQLSALPAHSMVYYIVYNRDRAGVYYHPLQFFERLLSASNAPIYSWVDSIIGRGIVGGSLKNQKTQVDAVAELAVRVLNGERASDIPVAVHDFNVNQVDWRQLQRWGIQEARIPSGTAVLFREPSVWDRYERYIVGAVGLILAQALLIAGLLVQASRRRVAEQRLMASDAQLRRSYEQISALGGRLLLAQEAERSRIALELHDDIGQQLTLLSFDLQTLSPHGRPGRRSGDTVIKDALARVTALARSIHDLSHRLHPANISLRGLVSALESLQRQTARPGVNIGFTHENVPSGLSHDFTLCVFRVVQEALQNALKHGGARNISIHLTGADGRLEVTIADDGAGFTESEAVGKGLGLAGMSERFEAIGGTLTVRSVPGSGTWVKGSAPIASARGVNAVAV